MKKIILIISLLVIGVLVYSQRVAGQERSSILKDNNQKVVTIDEIDHLQETHYAPSGFFTLGEMIESLDTEVYAEDRVEVFPEPKFGLGAKLTITRTTPVKVIDAGEEEIYRTWQTKVFELFDEYDIEVGESDKISVDLNQKLRFEMEIEITRVSSGDYIEYEEIDYKTITKNDATLERGKTKVGQIGKVGKEKFIYEIIRENGEEISRKLIDTEILKKPQDKIILEGTKVVIYGKGTATWYDPPASLREKALRAGWISGMTAASNSLPYGTRVLVRTSNGREVEVTIVDHGIQGGAIIDLSREAFSQLASLGAGRISVTLEKP